MKGFVDRIEDGFISGWVYDEENIKNKINIVALVNNQVIGEGIADGYRLDLQTAKIGDAHHAFKIKIKKNIDVNEKSVLELFDAKTNKKISLLKNSATRLELSTNNIFKKLLSVDNHLVNYHFQFHKKPLNSLNLSFLIDEELVFKTPANSENIEIKGEFLLSKKYLDGNLHILHPNWVIKQ